MPRWAASDLILRTHHHMVAVDTCISVAAHLPETEWLSLMRMRTVTPYMVGRRNLLTAGPKGQVGFGPLHMYIESCSILFCASDSQLCRDTTLSMFHSRCEQVDFSPMARWFPLIPGYYLLAVSVVVILSATQVLLGPHDYNPLASILLRVLGPTKQNDEYKCEQPTYTARIASYSPLVIHLENFITPKEAQHLIALGTPLLQPSFVFSQKASNDLTRARSRERSSSSAHLRGPDPVVDCVRQRASLFQGHAPLSHMETLQMVHYGPSEHFALHKDWGRKSPAGYERLTTFFAFLKADCKECGTHFPHLTGDWGKLGAVGDEDWCRLVECESAKDGTVFRALEGSAVFWRNLDDDGVGDNRTLHAGLPPESGEKVGLNIWTRDGHG